MAAAEIIEELAQGRRLIVLDVGGFDNAFADFLPGHEVIPYTGHITAEAPLHRPDGSMDVAVALDVLEHVPPEDRRFFLGELARVSRLACVVGFPYPGRGPGRGVRPGAHQKRLAGRTPKIRPARPGSGGGDI